MAVFASASSSRVKYDVFISFRGSDIRSGFLSHLTKELRRKQVDVYVDDRLERGDQISSALDEAIEGSMIALVIFSKDYASSKWCLQELVKIMECKEASGQIVLPVFYCVDPSDVRRQKRTYADAFAHLELKFKDNSNELKNWRSVLKKTADLSGYHSSNFQNESQLIDAILQDVLKKLEDNNPVAPQSHLVGLDQNLAIVESLMKITSQEVLLLGIWGVGGIGKTTLARATFDKFSSQFESYCFIENVREESTKSNGLSHLRQKLLSKLLDQDAGLPIDMNYARRRLSRKRVLIVLDDVSNSKQLKDLAGQQLCLGRGSRVIVTSRDKHVFRIGGIHDEYIHEVKELNFEESLKLFSLHAFKQTHPNVGYERLSEMTVAYAKGIPLALEVLGSHFHSRDKAYWESELEKLRKCPHPEIQNILKVSYDGLDDMDKEIFLDIAFFFIGEEKDRVIHVLEACGFKAVSGIQNLMDKSLIKPGWLNGKSTEMHDLIREMAKQIVRAECIKDPALRSRLKDTDEIYNVLESNMGTNKIEGIILDLDQIKHLQLDPDTFAKMKNLRFLKIFHPKPRMIEHKTYHHIELPFGLGSFPKKLRQQY
ncbi:disease resistance protein RPV1-like [Prosopis cineraria]|uniref:disease resistance protein RPV1-like n=1 Tax=Prosopis cineraria TaxID=364024 RepID=UPI00240F221F|nr:disease resistance protein RPV1-like [Prosopis cineraria]XP_054780084.1 disease resistance protein RPV1-like [Prosopis cineraria]